MKIYFIGGTGEFSSKIVEDLDTIYGHEVIGVGRTTGHAVPEENKKICKEALDSDVIVLFTYASGSQLELVHDIFKTLKINKWGGHFINIGSTIVLHPKGTKDKTLDPWQVNIYRTKKKAIRDYGYEISRDFTKHDFKFTQLHVGMLANKKMKQLDDYRNNCLQHNDISNMINWIACAPKNWNLHEIMIDGY